MTDFNNILLIDTALNGVNICLYKPQRQQAVESYIETVRGQAEQIVPMIQDVIKRSDLKFSDIDAIVTTLGPGSFTGLRLGISAANSLALSLDIPVYGISSFDVVKWTYMGEKDTASSDFGVILETKRSDFYVQLFDQKGLAITNGASLSHDKCWKLLADHNILNIIGDACERFTAESGENKASPHLSQSRVTQAKLTNTAIQFIGQSDSFIKSGKPIYLRGADISQPKKILRQVSSN